MTKTTLSKRLARLRTKVANLSNAELDKLCGLRKGHTRSLETNPKANPELKTLQAIARVFRIPVGYLAAGEGPVPADWQIVKAIEDARAGLRPLKEEADIPEEGVTFPEQPARPRRERVA
jgi:DNA-binding XRE family transcriptional regulator